MSLTFCYWSAWPNRHLEPFLDEAFRAGALRHVVYAHAAHMHQLGTAPGRRDADRETILEAGPGWRDVVRARLRIPCDVHLFYAIDRTINFAMDACARAGLPYVYASESLQPRARLEPRRIAREVLYRFVLRGAAGVLAVGSRAARDFEALGIGRDRIVPLAYPGPRPVEAHARAEPGEIAYCGRLIELKGLDLLSEALLSARTRAPGLRLSVIGAGPDDAPLSRLAAAGFPVERHGAVSSASVEELLARAGALALPTRRREGWGYVVNEAAALGVPSVVSDVVAAREIIVPGETGSVFPAGDAAALGEALLETLALQQRPPRLARALRETQRGLDPGAFLAYFLSASRALLEGASAVPFPPWLVAAERLGGNADTRWWRSWRSFDGSMAAAR